MGIKAGVIGYGYMGNYHIRKCSERDDIEVVAVHDICPEKFCDIDEKYPDSNIRSYTVLRDFLADEEIELVFICTPNNSHRNLSIACLRAGKNVMCEKPVALNLQELDEILQVAEEEHKVFTAHQNRRWDSDFLVVKDVIGSGEIGRVTNLISCVHGQRGVCFGWRADPKAGGGMLYDWGIHLIDQILQLFPNNKVASVYARMLSVLTPAVDDYFELKMIFDNKMCASILVTTFSLQDRPRWFVYGDRGTLKLDDFSGKRGGAAKIREGITGFNSVFTKAPMGPTRTMSPLQPEFIEEIPLPVVQGNPHEYHRNLAEACRGSEKQYVTHQDMRRAMMIIDYAFESSERNEVIKAEI